MQNEHNILSKDLTLLNISDEFLDMAKKNGFSNLGDIVQFPISKLKKKTGMNYRMLSELGEILKQYNFDG